MLSACSDKDSTAVTRTSGCQDDFRLTPQRNIRALRSAFHCRAPSERFSGHRGGAESDLEAHSERSHGRLTAAGTVETLRVGTPWKAAERFLDLSHALLTAATCYGVGIGMFGPRSSRTGLPTTFTSGAPAIQMSHPVAVARILLPDTLTEP